jgi:hypothetical protein
MKSVRPSRATVYASVHTADNVYAVDAATGDPLSPTVRLKE